MAIINEKKLLQTLKESKNVLLIEPPYRRSYIPLGLAKIATYIKSNGGRVEYCRSFGRSYLKSYDLICIATCFTNDSKIVINSIK